MLVRTAALHAPPAAPLLLMGTSDDERTSDPHAVATATAKAAAAAAADSAATVSAATAAAAAATNPNQQFAEILLASCDGGITVKTRVPRLSSANTCVCSRRHPPHHAHKTKLSYQTTTLLSDGARRWHADHSGMLTMACRVAC